MPPPPGSEPMIASNYRAKSSYEQRQVAWNIAACYNDGVQPHCPSRLKIYESSDKHCKKEDAATLTNIDA